MSVNPGFNQSSSSISGSIAVVPTSGVGDPLYNESLNAVVVTPSTSGTMAVYFDPATPSVSATFSGSISAVPETGSGDPMYEETGNHLRVLIAGSQAAASLVVSQATAGNLNVTEASASGILADTNAIQTAVEIMDDWDESDRAKVNVIAGEAGVAANSGVVGDTTQRVVHVTDVGSSVRLMSNSGVDIGDVDVTSVSGTVTVKQDPDGTLGAIRTALPTGSNVIGKVHDLGGTTTIQQTLAGSTSAVSTSGATIKSPISSRVIKVYAFSLTTTAQTGLQCRFTNGSGASPTTKWQVALQAPSQGIAGANLAVTPPGYLFAMASNTTLALVLDSGSKVHYSVGYFLESA